MLDLQHIPNIKDGKRLIAEYKIGEGIAISIPSNEHKRIEYQCFSNVQEARTLLAREIKRIRKSTGIPPIAFIKIIEANKRKYPRAFKKAANGF